MERRRVRKRRMRSWKLVKELKNDTVVREGEEVDEVVEEALSPFSFRERKGQNQKEKERGYIYLYIIFAILFNILF